MNIRERLEAFWAGERPDEIPYTIYHTKWQDVKDDPAWGQMFAQGLGVTFKEAPFKLTVRDLEISQQHGVTDGVAMRRVTWRTPVGEITATWADDWQQEYWLKTSAD